MAGNVFSVPLSGSGPGYAPILITSADVTNGTLIHQAVNLPDGTVDAVFLSVANPTAADVNLLLAWGDTANPVVKNEPIKANTGPQRFIEGERISGGLTITVAGNGLIIMGYVNRVPPPG